MTKIQIQNRQKIKRPRRDLLLLVTRELLVFAARLPTFGAWRELTVLLVDDAECAAINRAALGHRGPTDVITMTYPAVPGEPQGDIAEIVLNVERAWQLADTPAGASAELALYLAHGIDHLCGFNDQSPESRRSMRRREQRWLRQLGDPATMLFQNGKQDGGPSRT